MTHGHGLVIGKFLPPHRGHEFLIGTAVLECDATTIIVCGRRTDPIPGDLRRDWLQELHPTATVRLIEDRYDPDDSQVWADNVRRWLGRAPDVVFTSEDYGHRFAQLLGCRHVLVDHQRATVPCSGTMIREDPYAHWDFLPAPVREWYAMRVCILGAESTGTTTLAQSLAERYQTVWVPEYGRAYSELKFAKNDHVWRSEEFMHIAEEQSRRENSAARAANRLLICDTNSLATCIWHRRYMGFDLEDLHALATRGRCDLYVLTGDEIAFVQDGLRDGEHIRHEMHSWFRDVLAAQSVPWIEVRGSHNSRLAQTHMAIQQLFADSRWSPGPAE